MTMNKTRQEKRLYNSFILPYVLTNQTWAVDLCCLGGAGLHAIIILAMLLLRKEYCIYNNTQRRGFLTE